MPPREGLHPSASQAPRVGYPSTSTRSCSTYLSILQAKGCPNAPGILLYYLITLASAQSRNGKEGRIGLSTSLFSSKGVQGFHLTHHRTKGTSTKIPICDSQKKPNYSFPCRVFCTYTSHGVHSSNPHLVSFLGTAICQWQTLVRLSFTLIFLCFWSPKRTYKGNQD